MEICLTALPCSSTRETWEIHCLTDTHIDDVDFAERELKERIAHIRDTPQAVWLGGGDYGSLIVPGDKRFGDAGSMGADWLEHIGRIPDYYLERCEKLFSPIADKCIGLLAGNHEGTIAKNYHRGIVAELASILGKPDLYLGDRGWSVLRFELGGRKVPLKIFSFHGWSHGRLKGRKAIQAERELGGRAADVFFLGHDHQPYADIWYTEHCEGGRSGYVLKMRPRAVVNGGSWTYGQTAPTRASEKRDWKISEMPKQRWVESKNFRPQPPANPYLLAHIDFGSSRDKDSSFKGRAAGFDLEVAWRGNRFVLGEV